MSRERAGAAARALARRRFVRVWRARDCKGARCLLCFGAAASKRLLLRLLRCLRQIETLPVERSYLCRARGLPLSSARSKIAAVCGCERAAKVLRTWRRLKSGLNALRSRALSFLRRSPLFLSCAADAETLKHSDTKQSRPPSVCCCSTCSAALLSRSPTTRAGSTRTLLPSCA